MARIATDTQLVVSGPLKAFAEEIDMGAPLHSLVLCGELHEIELQMYEHFLYTNEHIQAQIAKFKQPE